MEANKTALRAPKISVIIVTYNAAKTLEEALISVLNQTYKNFELIIIDGKSTDQTVNIIDKYNARINYWISEKDAGIYDAMNKGIAVSTGEWILFLGADDVFFENNMLTRIFDADQLDCDFIYGDIVLKSRNKIIGMERDFFGLIDKNISHQAIFYKKKIFDKIGIYNSHYPILADYDLNLRIFKDGEITKKYIPNIVTLYNDRGVSNRTLDMNFFSDKLNYLLISENFSKDNPLLQQYYFYNGITKIWHGSYVNGVSDIWHCLRIGNRKLLYLRILFMLIIAEIGIGRKVAFK